MYNLHQGSFFILFFIPMIVQLNFTLLFAPVYKFLSLLFFSILQRMHRYLYIKNDWAWVYTSAFIHIFFCLHYFMNFNFFVWIVCAYLTSLLLFFNKCRGNDTKLKSKSPFWCKKWFLNESTVWKQVVDSAKKQFCFPVCFIFKQLKRPIWFGVIKLVLSS